MNRSMQRFWMKRRREICIGIAVVAAYLLLRPCKYDYSAATTLPKTHPSDVWEFVADFSNMKYLNPSVEDFNVLSESGNYEHWKYAVEYKEHLTYWPYLPNVNVGHFDVKAEKGRDVYRIQSVHKTCIVLGLVCLDTVGEFKFTKSASGSGAFCEESIRYECPPVMAAFCRREVVHQRANIMENLKLHFQQKK